MDKNLYRWLDSLYFRQETSIITYHGFTDKASSLENYQGKHLHIQKFMEHLKLLHEHYHVISLHDFIHCCLFNKTIPEKSVILTFDDGYESNYTLAYPALKEFDMPATIFIATDFIEQKQFLWGNRIEHAIIATRHQSLPISLEGKELMFDLTHDEAKKDAINTLKPLLKSFNHHLRNKITGRIEQLLEQKLSFHDKIPDIHKPLGWGQMQEMVHGGLVTIAGHTCSHAILTQCDPEMLEQEITDSKNLIEQKLGISFDLFCYPYGHEGTFNNTTKTALQKAGYKCALTTIKGSNNPHSDLFQLKRLGTSNEVGIDHFESMLSISRPVLQKAYKKICRF